MEELPVGGSFFRARKEDDVDETYESGFYPLLHPLMSSFPRGVPGTRILRPDQILPAGQDQMLPSKKCSILIRLFQVKFLPADTF